MTILIRPAAKLDFENIWTYTEETWGKVQAEDYFHKFKEILRSLEQFPDLGRIREDLLPEIRSIGVGQHVIFYRRVQEDIEIVRVLHKRMDPARHVY